MKQSESEKLGTMYVQTTLKQRKAARYLLRTGDGTGSYDIQEGGILDDIDLAWCLTLREEERTAMRKRVKEMNPLCFSYDTDFRNLSKKPDLDARESEWEGGLCTGRRSIQCTNGSKLIMQRMMCSVQKILKT